MAYHNDLSLDVYELNIRTVSAAISADNQSTGVGGVGHQVLTQLGTLTKSFPNIRLILISRSNKSLRGTADKPIDITNWEKELNESTSPALSVRDTIDILARTAGKCVLVDNTSTQDVADAYPELLHRGISVVTPNKKAFSSSMNLWSSIQTASYKPRDPYLERGLMYHESSVGAGLPIISTLKDLIDTGDEVHRIEGVFSGTMSFLFNNFAPVDGKGGKWSQEVTKAKEAGFTEADPRDDLNGVDVARKLVILARLVGLDLAGTQSFPVQSLIPSQLEEVGGAEEFMARLAEFDGEMDKIKNDAISEGKVVRFVGSIDVKSGAAKVGVEKFEKSHPIAGLKGSDNIVNFYTKRYGSSPLVVQGAGAGGAVTAMGVTADLIKVIQRIS